MIIIYTPYGDNSTFIEDPSDSPHLYDYDGDGFSSYSIRRECNASGIFNAHQLGSTNFNWGRFDIIDHEWYDLGKLSPVGGISIPVDKLSLVAPYIALTSTIVLAISASVAYIKYRKKP